jgi:hypothetical protein
MVSYVTEVCYKDFKALLDDYQKIKHHYPLFIIMSDLTHKDLQNDGWNSPDNVAICEKFGYGEITFI